MIRTILLGMILLLAFQIVLPASASEPQPTKWSDLVPEKIPDPFKKLSQEQIQDVSYVLRVGRLIAEDKLQADGPDAKEAVNIEHRLRKDGVDVGYLLSLREQVRRLREKQANSIQSNLIGRTVQLTGYVVPLKKSDKLVTEFLLVPNFDACSHSIPPPPNQSILVRFGEGIACRGRVTAVRVTGRIDAKYTSRLLLRASGPTEFGAAYAITPQEVEVALSKGAGQRKSADHLRKSVKSGSVTSTARLETKDIE